MSNSDAWDGHWDDLSSGTFEDFWLDILDYAEETGLTASYVEEEFIIDGELIKANINFKKSPA